MYNAQFDLLNKSMQEDKDDAVKKAEPIIPTKIKGRLYEHQVKAYNYALKLFGIGGQRLSEKKSKAVAYLMDMGTGKTITTIVLVGAMNETNAVNKLLVVCPKSIVGVWGRRV